MAVIDVGNRDIEKENRSQKSDRRSKKAKKSAKPKKDVRAIVHKWCKVAMYRIFEFVILFFVLSIAAITVGSSIIPMLSFDMAASFGLTQSTDIYTGLASWGFPMLFYTLLISAATFCVLKKFVVWIHNKFTYLINKPEKTEENA